MWFQALSFVIAAHDDRGRLGRHGFFLHPVRAVSPESRQVASASGNHVEDRGPPARLDRRLRVIDRRRRVRGARLARVRAMTARINRRVPAWPPKYRDPDYRP